ncbi:hypothetical protein JWG45_09295 [Leptospira sp. 201903070]|uniref:Polysaccharide chain length determinant N-terminal domain-containing protein n=1 Tax=Leptospira ainlahdjerensis TaxID=2810033 RepID=A0ABS2UAE7_9LEPT|nr:hypothetical protein [Leptospira ainlahdjerensis]MBM9577346.1 hypothetical protein [Leptospira ainlahdjerensis]
MEQNSNQTNTNLNILDDEITLAQIIKTLIERKIWFFGIFLFVFSISLFFAYTKYPAKEPKDSSWKYTTYLFVGSYAGQSTPVEAFSSIKFAIEQIYAKNLNSNLLITIENDPVKTGNIVSISTIEESEDDENIRKIHEVVTRPILERHKELFLQSEKKGIETQANLKSSESRGLPTSILALAQKSKYVPSPDKAWIRILQIGFLISILLSCIGVFAIEYGLQIKNKLNV